MSNKQGIIFDDGVLYRHGENGPSEWLEDGDEKMDGRYIGEIENGEPNGQVDELEKEYDQVLQPPPNSCKIHEPYQIKVSKTVNVIIL